MVWGFCTAIIGVQLKKGIEVIVPGEDWLVWKM